MTFALFQALIIGTGLFYSRKSKIRIDENLKRTNVTETRMRLKIPIR